MDTDVRSTSSRRCSAATRRSRTSWARTMDRTDDAARVSLLDGMGAGKRGEHRVRAMALLDGEADDRLVGMRT